MNPTPFTFAQATEIADRRLRAIGCDDARIHLTEEFDAGWVFYYQSARYLDTGEVTHALAGNAPVFVARSDGQAFLVSYHRPLAESLAAYRACGNPNAREIPQVRLVGWRVGAKTVSAILAIHRHSSFGLAQAKNAIEDCLGHQSPVIGVASIAAARALVSTLAANGFEAVVCHAGD